MSQEQETKKVEEVTPTPEKSEVEKKDEIINNLVEELKVERTKKQEAERVAQDLLKDVKPDEKDDVTKTVQAEIERRDNERLEAERKQAYEEFRLSKSEFSPDNDPGDIKYNMFKKEMEKFNFSGLKTKAEVETRLQEIYEFVNRTKSATQSGLGNFAHTPSGGGTPKADDNDANLSKSELELIKSKGWSTDKYLKLKQKHPAFIAQTLRISNM